jgi:hypothetical protein
LTVVGPCPPRTIQASEDELKIEVVPKTLGETYISVEDGFSNPDPVRCFMNKPHAEYSLTGNGVPLAENISKYLSLVEQNGK